MENQTIKIRRAVLEDVKAIAGLINEAVKGLEDSSWFVADDEAFIRRHISEPAESFILTAWSKADEAWTGAGAVQPETLAAYLIVRHPGQEEDNLGLYLQEYQADIQLENVFHMESAAVSRCFAGNHLQYWLMKEAEEKLKRTNSGCIWLCGTIHPDNKKSLHTFQKLGYGIVATVKKYGGLDRHIVVKKI